MLKYNLNQLALISGQSTLNTHDTSVEPTRDQIATFSGLPTPSEIHLVYLQIHHSSPS